MFYNFYACAYAVYLMSYKKYDIDSTLHEIKLFNKRKFLFNLEFRCISKFVELKFLSCLLLLLHLGKQLAQRKNTFFMHHASLLYRQAEYVLANREVRIFESSH